MEWILTDQGTLVNINNGNTIICRGGDEIVLDTSSDFVHLCKVKDNDDGNKKIANLAAKISVIRMGDL